MSATLNKKIMSGLGWIFMENIGSQLIQFVVTIMLARLLVPAEFGLVAIVLTFNAFLSVFVEGGLESALIQRKNLKPEDCNATFFLNLLVAGVCYCGIFVAAPFIADFYNSPQMTSVLRVLSLSILLLAIHIVPRALIFREMKFNVRFKIMWPGLCISAVVGISMAYGGFGVWALVFRQLCGEMIFLLLIWYYSRWKPSLRVNWNGLREMVGFGWKIFTANLMETAFNAISPLLIGKMFSLKALSFYNQGSHYPNIFLGVCKSLISYVMFPVLASIQDDLEHCGKLILRAHRFILFVVCPVAAWLMVIAEIFVRILLTDQWLPSIPFMRIFCLGMIFIPGTIMNIQATNAVGRSDVFLGLEIAKKILLILVIVVACHFGVIYMAWGGAIMMFFGFFLNAMGVQKLFRCSLLLQLREFAAPLLLSGCSGALAFAVVRYGEAQNVFLIFTAASAAFGISYLLLSLLFQRHVVLECVKIAKTLAPNYFQRKIQ